MIGWLQFFGIIIGFSGVCLTLLVNAAVAELRRRHDIQHRATVLRTSLRSELLVIRRDLEAHESNLQSNPVIFHPFHPTQLTRIYDSSLADLGLLSVEETDSLVSVYTLLRQRLTVLDEWASAIRNPAEIGPVRTLDRINPLHNDTIVASLASVRILIEEANEAINLLVRKLAAPVDHLSLRSIVREIATGQPSKSS